MALIDVGNVAIVSKGPHILSNAYEPLNEVQENSTKNWFRAKKSVPAQTPLTNTEFWELVRDNTNVGGDNNVQSDWNETDPTADEFIKNKPNVGNDNVQSDWNETDPTADEFIKNKPNVVLHDVVITKNHQAVAGTTVVVDATTIGNDIEITVPVNPANNDLVRLKNIDMIRTNKVLIKRATGVKINGLNQDADFNCNCIVTLEFNSTTNNWMRR